ncbi:sugar ABC transporter ATP-binding protein [Arthrobacter sp. GCM10027362]|uniref:sugar ABC transporter ATP-binding protein n=1 Tax=Arthrobacter sp. GCM10027362 TaxID=3273379 RepID=UPI00363A7C46
MNAVSDRNTPLLEVQGLSKHFGGVPALLKVDLTVSRGAVHGVLGKNGAGKSTLMAAIAGSLTPDEGRVLFEGRDITHLPIDARQSLGIHLMEQHSEVFTTLTVAENLVLPNHPRRGLLVDWDGAYRHAREVLDRFGLDVDPGQLAGSLSLPEQRKLNLVKTLSDHGKLAILDEPTTSMSREERSELFSWIRDLTQAGLTFIYITHFNRDLIELCDEYTVLRDGRVTGAGGSIASLSEREIAKLVTGADVVEFERDRRAAPDVLLEVDGVRTAGSQPITFGVGKGEVLGLVGLPGSGARETARALAGLETIESGRVVIGGREVAIGHSADALKAGIAYLPSDRNYEGVVPEFSVQENLHVGNWPAGRPWGFLDFRRMLRNFQDAKSAFNIRTSGPGQLIKNLSGGNQQKVLLGRLIETKPTVLILDEPTAGIDVEAKEEVHRIVDQLSEQGVGVILVAYDPAELVRLVDRALIFRDGELVRELSGDSLTGENVLASISHAHSKKAEAK